MDADMDLSELLKKDTNLDIYALKMLGRVIALEERRTGRMSGLRVFSRMDISIYRERVTGDHHYFVNEITRTHGAALFQQWDSSHRLNLLFTHMSNTLHYISHSKLYLQPPETFFI